MVKHGTSGLFEIKTLSDKSFRRCVSGSVSKASLVHHRWNRIIFSGLRRFRFVLGVKLLCDTYPENLSSNDIKKTNKLIWSSDS